MTETFIVLQLATGRWIVRLEQRDAPLSQHEDAGTATLAAVEHARRAGGGDVLVRDAHHCVHLERHVRARPRARAAA
jgi:hypothetical protein